MQSEHLFARNEKLASWFTNALGSFLGLGAFGFTLTVRDPTHIQVLAGPDEDAAIVAVEGRWRWVEATVVRAHPGGAAGTYDIYVTARETDISDSPQAFTDDTNYAWDLQIVAHGATPTIVPGTVDRSRKVGELQWNGGQITSIYQTVPGTAAHAAAHEPGGVDPVLGLTDASFDPANKDGAAATPSLRTLGTGAQQAAPGNDSRLTGARTPTPHASSHAPGGSDALAVDAAPSVGSARTLGTGANQAAAGNDPRFSGGGTPGPHASTHEPGGSDPLHVDAAAGTGSLRTLGTGATQAAAGSDVRLSNARSPTAHAASHAPGGSDPLTADAAPGTASLRSLGSGANQAAAGNDPRFSNPVGPHAATHEPGGSDPLAVDSAAGTGSLRTLGAGAQQAAAGTDSRLSNARTPTAHVSSHLAGGSDALPSDAATGTPSLRSLGSGAQQAAAGNDARLSDARAPTSHAYSHARGGNDPVMGVPPIGAIVPYTGSGDPGGGDYVIADGRLIDRTTYAGFFGVTGHAYNAGIDPGNNKVRIPDKRGKVSMGAVSMGSPAGAATADNAHAQAARGASGGEVDHTLTGSESGLPNHGHGTNDPGHMHLAGSWQSTNQLAQTSGAVGDNSISSAGLDIHVPYHSGGSGWNDTNLVHSHPIDPRVTNVSVVNAAAQAASAGHNNLPPYEADSFLVRIA